MAIKPLTSTRVDEVVDLLGFDGRPAADLDGLSALYRAWCRQIPFDNARKLVGMHFEMPELPGIDPADFFAAWQFTGAGATCWGSNNALHALLVGLGFDARLHAGSMFDGDVNHGTTIVVLDDDRWLVDTAIHSDEPIALVDGQPATVEHCGYRVSVRPDPGGWLVDIPTPDPDFFVPCRVRGEIDYAVSLAANEKSRGWSPFNSGIMAQINDNGGVWMLKDGGLARIEETGTTTRQLTPAEEDAFLVETIGHSEPLVAEVRRVLVAQADDAGEAD